MAEGNGGGGAKVRVVRCPKCEKLLPELPNFTVYRCGSCGATLQAKKQNPASTEASSASSDGLRVKNLESLEGSPQKNELVSDASSGTGGDGDRIVAKKEKPVLINSASESASEEMSVSREPVASKLNEIPGDDVMESKENSDCHPSKAPVADPKLTVEELVKGNVKEDRKHNVQAGEANGSHNVHQAQLSNSEERDQAPAFRRPTRAQVEGIRLAPYPDEGPSNYYSNPRYRHGFGGPFKKHSPGASKGIEHLEQDRAELLRKLDELRDQLRRSCEVADKPKERPPMSQRTVSMHSYGNQGHGAWFPEGPALLNHASAQHSSFLNRHNVDVPNFYPPYHAHNEIPGHGEPFLPQTTGRAPLHHPTQYPRRPLDNYLYGQFDPDPFISYHHDGLYHQPACSCVHCYNRHWPVPAHALPTIFSNPRIPYLVNHHGVYTVHNPPTFAPYNQRKMNDSSLSHEPRSHQKAVSNGRDVQSLRPVAGAAPFVVCCNCFELLQLPQKFPLAVNGKHKLQCGSCSQVISYELDGKRLVTYVPAPSFNATSETNNNSNYGMKDGLPSHPSANQQPVISYSGDYESPGYGPPSTDEKLVLSSPFSVSSNEPFEKEYGLDLSEPEKVQGLSSPSSTSENVESTDSLVCQRNLRSSTELPLEAEETLHAPGVPLREHFGYPSSNQVMDGPGKGSRSKRSDQEKILSINGNFKQNSVKDVQVATEMDVPVDEYPNHVVSEDSWDVSNHEDHSRVGKGGESFLAGLIKKSFKDFSRFNSVDNGRSKVVINGHPISDRLVKKAEKQAGHIHPGEYWYDYRAGFWGVMGHACLGIIPPFIEEFNYPMPKDCGGGNTGVFVNRRELHQKDLDLLSARGLPTSRGQSYIIEISGKVWDEATGEELDSLGKLAPTVEKVKHGFGMRVPRVIV